MKCSFVHKALSAIDTAEEESHINLDHRLAAQLNEIGLVSSYTTWFYQEMVSSAAKLDRIRKRLKKAPQNDELAENLRGKIKKLEAMPDPEGYKPTLDGNYVKLSEKGELVNAHLLGRLPELEDLLLEDVESELDEFQSRIDAQYSRFIGIHNLMKKDEFKQYHNDVIDCAVRLSTMEGHIPNIYERMIVINDNIYSKGIKTYHRLIPTAAVTMQPGLIERLQEGAIEAHQELIKKGYAKNFHTWWLAAEVMNIGRSELKENVERYDEVRTALEKKGWNRYNHHTVYMAVNLARRYGSAEELVREHQSLQLKLVERGKKKYNDLGTAALILMDGEGTLDERVDRFTEAFEVMHSNGWDTYVKFYPAAAAITLMPGPVEENVLWLDRIVARLKKGGFANKNVKREGHKDGLTYRALPMLMAVYKGQFRQEVTPNIIVHFDNKLVK